MGRDFNFNLCLEFVRNHTTPGSGASSSAFGGMNGVGSHSPEEGGASVSRSNTSASLTGGGSSDDSTQPEHTSAACYGSADSKCGTSSGAESSAASQSGSAPGLVSDHSTAKGGVSSQQNSSSTMSEETESQTQQSVNHNAATDPGSLSVDGSHSDGTGGAPSDSSAYSKCETSSGVPATNLSSVGGVEAMEESASRSAA